MEDKVFELLEKMYIEFSGRFDTMEKEIDAKFDKIDSRFDGIDARLDKMDARFDGIDARLDKMDTRFDNIENDIKVIKSNMATKEDLNLLGTELHTEIQAVHDEVREIKVDINKIEKIVAKNTYDIEKLKLA